MIRRATHLNVPCASPPAELEEEPAAGSSLELAMFAGSCPTLAKQKSYFAIPLVACSFQNVAKLAVLILAQNNFYHVCSNQTLPLFRFFSFF